jgi:hypothetical protein
MWYMQYFKIWFSKFYVTEYSGEENIKQFFIISWKISFLFFGSLILFKIWGFHGGDYEEWCLLGCYAVWLL